MHRLGRQGGARRVRAISQRLPFVAASVDLAYFHLSIHYGDLAAAIVEAGRVLRRGGRLVIWTMLPEYHRRSFLARWFPTIGEVDARRFPDAERIVRHAAAAGFEPIDVVAEDEVKRRKVGDWKAAVEAGFVSTLQLVDPAELAGGLRRFTEQHPDPEGEVEYVMEFTGISGTLDRRRGQLPS